jgi:hypothetical protein
LGGTDIEGVFVAAKGSFRPTVIRGSLVLGLVGWSKPGTALTITVAVGLTTGSGNFCPLPELGREDVPDGVCGTCACSPPGGLEQLASKAVNPIPISPGIFFEHFLIALLPSSLTLMQTQFPAPFLYDPMEG